MDKLKRGLLVFVFIIIINLSIFNVNSLGENMGGLTGSGANGEIQNAMQAVQQVLSVISSIVGNLKTDIQTKQQGEIDRQAKVNAPRLPSDPTEQNPKVIDSETNSGRVSVNFSGFEFMLTDKNTGNKIIVGSNLAGGNISINTNTSIENIITSNSTVLVSKEGVDLGIVQTGNESTLIDDGSAKTTAVPKTASSTANTLLGWFIPLVSAEEMFTSSIFTTQYVVFRNHDIFINGKGILFVPLKPYDTIFVNGSGLTLMEKDVDVFIEKDRTYFSRVVGTSNFFINKIINENDPDNVFSLEDGGSDGMYFSDSKKILTVGDAVVTNPIQGYENIVIPRNRYLMWKNSEKNI